jgi:N-acyl-D-amino-acid deacylase
MIGSDGGIRAKSELVHPRYYGTFPRIFKEYVRGKNVLRIEEAVKKMTSFPAVKFGINDRGVLRPGMKADITIFNHETFGDLATFDKPSKYPTGISRVIVNGHEAWDANTLKIRRHGMVIRKV